MDFEYRDTVIKCINSCYSGKGIYTLDLKEPTILTSFFPVFGCPYRRYFFVEYIVQLLCDKKDILYYVDPLYPEPYPHSEHFRRLVHFSIPSLKFSSSTDKLKVFLI